MLSKIEQMFLEAFPEFKDQLDRGITMSADQAQRVIAWGWKQPEISKAIVERGHPWQKLLVKYSGQLYAIAEGEPVPQPEPDEKPHPNAQIQALLELIDQLSPEQARARLTAIEADATFQKDMKDGNFHLRAGHQRLIEVATGMRPPRPSSEQQHAMNLARDKLERLEANPEFQNAWMDPRAPGHKETKALRDQTFAAAFRETPQPGDKTTPTPPREQAEVDWAKAELEQFNKNHVVQRALHDAMDPMRAKFLERRDWLTSIATANGNVSAAAETSTPAAAPAEDASAEPPPAA